VRDGARGVPQWAHHQAVHQRGSHPQGQHHAKPRPDPDNKRPGN
jgi:hypothetical protein